jgi:hypothetical protein
MLRAAVLSMVLILAAGPSASLLCRAWCDSRAAASTGCHDQAPATTPIVADNSCDDMVLNADAFLREDAPCGVSTPEADQTVLVRSQLAPPPTDARPGQEPGRGQSLEERPLPTTLRI